MEPGRIIIKRKPQSPKVPGNVPRHINSCGILGGGMDDMNTWLRARSVYLGEGASRDIMDSLDSRGRVNKL